MPLVYEELRRLAAQKLAREAPGQTLQAAALVHEAYLRLVGSGGPESPEFANRRHFFAAAAEAMRRILVESARRKKRQKRGSERARIDLDAAAVPAPKASEDLLALDEALTRLAELDRPRKELEGYADLCRKRRTDPGPTLRSSKSPLRPLPRTWDSRPPTRRSSAWHECSSFVGYRVSSAEGR